MLVSSDVLLKDASQEATSYVCHAPDYTRQLSGGEMTSLRSPCHPPDIRNVGTSVAREARRLGTLVRFTNP